MTRAARRTGPTRSRRRPGPPAGVRAGGTAAVVTLVVAALFVAAPGATGRLGGAVTAAAAGRRSRECTPGELAGSLELAGDAPSTSPAGAVVLEPRSASCTLSGVPWVVVADAQRASLGVLQAPDVVRHPPVVTLRPGMRVAVSVTWSSWSCPAGSYQLQLRFAGWSRPLDIASGPAAPLASASCASQATLYVGPVTVLRRSS